MQRCPLEKLILQIKLWDKYDPVEILGRAIQPPELRDIYNAIKNLQNTGALTIPPPIVGLNGEGINGTWRLRVEDDAYFFLTPDPLYFYVFNLEIKKPYTTT